MQMLSNDHYYVNMCIDFFYTNCDDQGQGHRLGQPQGHLRGQGQGHQSQRSRSQA